MRPKLDFFDVWEFFQNSIGEIEARMHNLSAVHQFNGCKFYYITHFDSHCYGKHVFINRETDGLSILRHEYGHRIQSKILGIFYLPIIFLPSYLHFLYWSNFRSDDWDGYYGFFCEKWANKLADKKR